MKHSEMGEERLLLNSHKGQHQAKGLTLAPPRGTKGCREEQEKESVQDGLNKQRKQSR